MTALAPAFADPVTDAQVAFRSVMDAMAHPGSIRPLACGLTPPRPLSPAAAAVALALLDHDAPFWLDAPLAGATGVLDWLRFHTGAPHVVRPAEAAFAILADPAAAPAFDSFALGSAEYPDRSTTLVMQVERFAGISMRLSGPGIAGSRRFAAEPLPNDFLAQIEANRELFPRGVDLVFVTADALAALPRSTRAQGEV